MPLLDHFHAPLSLTRAWSSFHTHWAVAICNALNAQLPSPRFLAEVDVSIGGDFKTDIAEFDEPLASGNGQDGGVAVATLPAMTRTVEVTFPEEVAVRIYDFRAGRSLVGVIELVSPRNKDRPAARTAFVTKCATFLHDRIGLIVADIVTEYHANLHRELMTLLGDNPSDLPQDNYLYATAYRPVLRKEQSVLDLWTVALTLGGVLPVLPLALRGAFVVNVDLEATYSEARRHCHL